MIIEYEEKYLEDIKDLLVELEKDMIEIDKDSLDILHKDYREKMALVDLDKVNKNNGKCYIYLDDNNNVQGLIMGILVSYDKFDYLDYKCPKKGEVIELIASKNSRGKGIGEKLINKIEKYFKSLGCEYMSLEVFAYNDKAINFYKKNGYHSRMEYMIKKID